MSQQKCVRFDVKFNKQDKEFNIIRWAFKN